MSDTHFPLAQALLDLAVRVHANLTLQSSDDFAASASPPAPRPRRGLFNRTQGDPQLPTGQPPLWVGGIDQVRARLVATEVPDSADLTDEDLMMLALLFAAFMEGDSSQRVLHLVRAIRPAGVERLGLLARIQVLLGRNLVCRDEDRRPPHFSRSVADGQPELVNDWVELHPSFLKRLLDPGADADPCAAAPPVVDHSRFLTGLLEYSQVLRGPADAAGSEAGMQKNRVQAWQALEDEAARSSQHFPFLEMVRNHGLDARERDALVYLFDERLKGMDCTVEELGNLLGTNPLDQVRIRHLFMPGSRLHKHALITLGGRSMFGRTRHRVALTDLALDEILGQEAGVLKENGIEVPDGGPLQERPALRRWDQVVLPESHRLALEAVLQRYGTGTRKVLQDWGVLSASTPDTEHAPAHLSSRSGLRLLFSGPSGTGKTLCAEALAQHLGRRLLVTDMGRLLSKWVGESQQRVTALFDDYERIVAASPLAPLLLLDECDQFLLTRGHPESGSEQMRHEMTNLFLERLDRVPGLVVATTNLVEVLDSAFNRRFDLKLEFPEPGPVERETLWRTHLPPAVPLLESIPFPELARRFPFNGGRIALVMQNALHVAATRGDGLRTRDLLEAASLEQRGAFGSGARDSRWGFRAH